MPSVISSSRREAGNPVDSSACARIPENPAQIWCGETLTQSIGGSSPGSCHVIAVLQACLSTHCPNADINPACSACFMKTVGTMDDTATSVRKPARESFNSAGFAVDAVVLRLVMQAQFVMLYGLAQSRGKPHAFLRGSALARRVRRDANVKIRVSHRFPFCPPA